MKNVLLVAITAVLALTGCETMKENPNTSKGVGIGAAAGGALGAIVGRNNGDTGKGAVIGAAAGAAIGGLNGRRMDNQAKELAKVAETKRTEQGLVSKMKSDILFETGKADLKATAKSDLAEMAGIMKKYPENVLAVHGYTDSTGSAKVNETLSQKRAEAVKNQLVANGVPSTTVSAMGMGPSNPVGDNSTAAGRQQNRRVEIEVTVDPSKVPQQETK
jgi:outer membrane protein OmpA-like peptidoglycan-associated protein